MSDSEFCFRACKPSPNAATFCQHIYDVMGCQWNMPGNYGTGFDQCAADSGEVRVSTTYYHMPGSRQLRKLSQPMGVYGTSTFFQGQPATPSAHPVPASSRCTPVNTIGNGLTVSHTIPPIPIPTSTSTTTTTTTSSSSSGGTIASQTTMPNSQTTSVGSGSNSASSTSLTSPQQPPSESSTPTNTTAPSSSRSTPTVSSAPTTNTSAASSAFTAAFNPESLSVFIAFMSLVFSGQIIL